MELSINFGLQYKSEIEVALLERDTFDDLRFETDPTVPRFPKILLELVACQDGVSLLIVALKRPEAIGRRRGAVTTPVTCMPEADSRPPAWESQIIESSDASPRPPCYLVFVPPSAAGASRRRVRCPSRPVPALPQNSLQSDHIRRRSVMAKTPQRERETPRERGHPNPSPSSGGGAAARTPDRPAKDVTAGARPLSPAYDAPIKAPADHGHGAGADKVRSRRSSSPSTGLIPPPRRRSVVNRTSIRSSRCG